jgi:hypothetical protein
MFGTYARNVLAKQGRYVPDNSRGSELPDHLKLPEVPTVPLRVCEFDKQRRVLKLASEFIGMPRTLYIESHHTGKKVMFVTVQSGDSLFDEDGWDGEQCIYRPADFSVNIDHLVIYHAW